MNRWYIKATQTGLGPQILSPKVNRWPKCVVLLASKTDETEYFVGVPGLLPGPCTMSDMEWMLNTS